MFGCARSLLLRLDSNREEGLLSSCSVQASHCSASLATEHRLWGTQASVVVARGLSSCGFQALVHRLNNCGAQA